MSAKQTNRNSTATQSTPHSKQSWVGTVAITVCFLLLGITLGSITVVGSALRSVIYGFRGEIDLSTAQEIYGILRTDFDGTIDTTALQDGAKTGLVAATGDQFTNYLTPQATTALMERMRGGGFIGIGVELGFKNGDLVIIAPKEGSPAQRAGVQAGDTIIAIDSVAVSTMSEEEVFYALRGDRGSTVTLTVQRDTQRLTFTIERQPITVPSVRYSVTDQNIGILTITTFDANTAHLSREAAISFRDKKVRGIIVDMRNNPGGAVNAAQGVLSLWLPKGSVVMTEKRNDTVLRTYRTETTPVVDTIPTVILMNGNSASASEVVAGALREYNKATIVGTQSFGKGSVQEVRPLSNNGALVFTVSRWFTPKGASIDGSGITPDTIVEYSTTSADETDPQLNAAVQKLL